MDKGVKLFGKQFLLNNIGLLLIAREKVLNSFKNRPLLIKFLNKTPTSKPELEPELEPEPKPSPEHRKSSLKSREEFLI